MGLDRELMRRIRRLDEFELRRLQIVIRGLLLHADGDASIGAMSAPTDTAAQVSFRQQNVRCGKRECSRCPHGPYWYAYWKENGRTRKRYVGRHLPGEPLEDVVPDQPASAEQS